MGEAAGRSSAGGRTVVVTGAGGQLGRATTRVFAEAGWRAVSLDRSQLDIVDRDAVLQAITHVQPAAVINTAAWTAVDACEADPERAFAVNALGPRHVAEASRMVGAHLVHVSTDYVFDGTLDRPYREWDEPRPRSVYGSSKLAGEREVGPHVTTVRTAWLAGTGGPNMVRTILGLAADPDRILTFVDDQRGSPTVAEDLAVMLFRLASERRAGLFHVTNQGEATWYEVAQHVLTAGGFDPARVKPVSTRDLRPQRPAPRPANAVLDNAVLRMVGLPLLSHWQDAVTELVRQLQSDSTI